MTRAGLFAARFYVQICPFSRGADDNPNLGADPLVHLQLFINFDPRYLLKNIQSTANTRPTCPLSKY